MNSVNTRLGTVIVACSIVGSALVPELLIARVQARHDSVNTIQWESFSEGIRKAGLTKRRILVDICATWCPWCKQMDEKVYSDPEIVSYIAQRYIAVRLNGEGKEWTTYGGIQMSESRLADSLGTKGYPTSVFLDHTGEFMVKLDGYINKEVFLKVLQYIGEDVFDTKSFTEFAGMSLPRSGAGTSGRRQPDSPHAGTDSSKVRQ